MKRDLFLRHILAVSLHSALLMVVVVVMEKYLKGDENESGIHLYSSKREKLLTQNIEGERLPLIFLKELISEKNS